MVELQADKSIFWTNERFRGSIEQEYLNKEKILPYSLSANYISRDTGLTVGSEGHNCLHSSSHLLIVFPPPKHFFVVVGCVVSVVCRNL